MNLFKKLAHVQVKDILAVFPLLLALPMACFMKRRCRDLWLICERPDDARDNGYHLFKYIRENHPAMNVYYAINKKAPDYKKIETLGNIIQFGSLRHYIYYLAAAKNISSQKGGKPNAALFFVLEVFGFINNTRIFLQHGITQNRLEDYLFYKNTKMKLVICGARPEYEFISRHFGYPEGSVRYLGFCRFDALHKTEADKKLILLMPTWRAWLSAPDSKSGQFHATGGFTGSEYLKKYQELINSRRLTEFLEENDIRLVFYPHEHMQKFIRYFSSSSSNVTLAGKEKFDVQDLLKRSALLITDYSSVFFDFAYMKKPAVYYQFDIAEFRKGNMEEGYFNYERDAFGPVCYTSDRVIDEIINLFQCGFEIENRHLKRIDEFFPIHDMDNCKRNFEAILKL